jgi:predicted secreted acid phosphatase
MYNISFFEIKIRKVCKKIEVHSKLKSCLLDLMDEVILLKSSYLIQHNTDFAPPSWRGVLDTTLCDKVCQ